MSRTRPPRDTGLGWGLAVSCAVHLSLASFVLLYRFSPPAPLEAPDLYVYVVKPDSTVQRQPVAATDRGPVMVISKGLDVGQAIVLDGQSRLQDGTLVTATMAAAGG